MSLNLGLPVADELLFLNESYHLCDLLSWVAIGARSSENYLYRAVASGLDIPVGIKNPICGSISQAVNSIVVARHPQMFIFGENQVETKGNPYAHIVLRGSNQKPNYDFSYLREVRKAH